MQLSELSYDQIRSANVTELFEIAENAGIQDDVQLSHSEDLRERIILIKRKMEGSSNIWKPLFRSVQEETKVKIDPLVQLMKTVQETFQIVPTDSLSEILRQEGHLQQSNLMEEISTRIRRLTERRCLVVIAGETNGGKSSFLNLLLQEDILPTDVMHCTFSICKIVYSDVYSIKTLDHDDTEEYFPCCSREEVKAILKNAGMQKEMKEREFKSNVKEITLGIPADILKSGVIVVDTPGIGENEVMDSVTMNFLKSTHASAFIYIIKSDTAGGVQEDRLLSFLQAIKDRYSTDAMMEAFDPRAAMFVCHRWDNIEDDQKEKVKQNALSKLEYVWPGFTPSQTYFFSTTDTMKHLPVDPEFVTDSFMLLLKGLKDVFDRACHNAIKHHYVWLKYMLQPAARHLKAMITHCIMSNEELEDYFRSVAEKQNKLMVSSTESSRKLQDELNQMSWELKSLVSNHLNFDAFNPRLEVPDCEEIIDACSREGFFVSQVNRRALDEMIVRSLLRRVDDFVHMRKVVNEIESKMLIAVQDHLGLFKCQIKQIKRDMLHGVASRISPSPSSASLDVEDTSTQFRASTGSLASSASSRSSIEAFQGNKNLDPSQLSMTVKNLLSRRKEGRPLVRQPANSKHEIQQSLLGKIGDRIKHGVLGRPEPAAYVEERIHKVSKNMRENGEVMDNIILVYTEWIQYCVTYAVDSIPKFIEVNTKLMDEIREHRGIFQRNKDVLVKVMENLEPCRHHLKGYGLLYMDDINAETLAFNTEHRTSTVSLPKYLMSESGRNVDSSFQGSISNGMWARMIGATIKIDDVANRVVIKTYIHDMSEKVMLSEIASLRCLEYTCLAPFMGMTRIASDSSTELSGESELLTEKVSAFIFKGDLVSARVYSKRHMVVMQQFIPEMVQSLLRGLNYIHREGLVHMELNLNTVMVDRITGAVKLCQMCKPREATLPGSLDKATNLYVCISPSALQGNVYESTDDIYAFGLLLWELIFPAHLPYKEQRLWTIKQFIEECHPSNMLQESLNSLDGTEGLLEVLKGSLLMSKRCVCMPMAKIQSLLADLHKEPAIMRLRTNKLSLTDNNNSAPVVEVTSPSGTETKLKFIFDDKPDVSASTKPDQSDLLSTSKCYVKSASTMHESRDKKGKGLFPPKHERRVSEPDFRTFDKSLAKPKKNPFQFLKGLLKRGSSKKFSDQESNPDEHDSTYESNSRRSSIPEAQDLGCIKRPSPDLQFFTPQLKPKFQSRGSKTDNPFDSPTLAKHKSLNLLDYNTHIKHKSLPDQSFFRPKSVSLGRKDSFDVPTLMFEKFRLSLGHGSAKNDASKLNPLSGLSSDLSLSGSTSSLTASNESTIHKKEEHGKREISTQYLTISTSSRRQSQQSSPVQKGSRQFQQGLRLGGSLQDLSYGSANHMNNSRKPLVTDNVSPNLHDRLTGASFLAISPKKSNRITRKPLLLTVSTQNGILYSTSPAPSANTAPDFRSSENKSITVLSSSTSSQEADSGFSSIASGRGVKDLIRSYDDLQVTSVELIRSGDSKNVVSDQTNCNFTSTINITVQGKSSQMGKDDSSTDAHNDGRGNRKEQIKVLCLENFSHDSEKFLQNNVASPTSEVSCDRSTSSDKIPTPPPINFSELSFTFGGFDYNLDE